MLVLIRNIFIAILTLTYANEVAARRRDPPQAVRAPDTRACAATPRLTSCSAQATLQDMLDFIFPGPSRSKRRLERWCRVLGTTFKQRSRRAPRRGAPLHSIQ